MFESCRCLILATGSRQPRLIAKTRSEKHEIRATAVTGVIGNCSICRKGAQGVKNRAWRLAGSAGRILQASASYSARK
jgi:hypothetical protein